MNILFICSRNRWRSPTAEAIFSKYNNVEVDSAGLSPDAEVRLSSEQIDWADIIFVMERRHRSSLSKSFARKLNAKRIICLNIPDRYTFMDPELIQELEQKVGPHLK